MPTTQSPDRSLPAGSTATETAPSSAPPGKTWRIGTITYTSGGLMVLFGMLLLGDFALAMRDRSVEPVSAWYLKQLGVPNLLFAFIMSSFPSMLSLFLSPVISMKSDNHRGRWGRRIPFLLVSTPLAAVGLIGIAFTPLVIKEVHIHFPQASEMLVGVICFSLFWTVFELGSIISHAIFGALLNDVVPRELLGRFFGLFRIVGLVDGIIFNFWILGYIPAHFTLIVASIGIFYGITFMWMSLKIKEGDYPPVATEAGDGDQKGVFARRWDGIKLYFRECYANPFYISVFLMLTLSRLAFLPVNTFAIPYARSLEVSMGTYGNYAAWMLCVSLVLAYPIGWLADLFHPIRLAMGALVAHIVICIWATFYATSADGFLLAFLLHGVAAGTYGTSAASLHQRLYPRLKFAQFASAGGILGSICTMTLTPLVGMLIDYSGNNYRHTFIIGGFLALSGLGFGLIVYSKLRKKDAALPQE